MPSTSAGINVVRPARARRRGPLIAGHASHRAGITWLVAAGAIAAGYTAIGIGYPSVAAAQPNNGGGGSAEWDIGAYDFCMSNHPPLLTTEDVIDHHRWCCESSGGVWGSGDNGCHAPAGELNAPTDPFGTGHLQAPHQGTFRPHLLRSIRLPR